MPLPPTSPAGFLVYAAGEDEPWHYRVRHLGKSISVTTLDLAGSEADLLASIDRVAADVRSLARPVWQSNPMTANQASPIDVLA